MNISLIVPTKNRPLYVERLLKYYSDLNFTGYIFVLDSSEKKISKDIRNFVKRTKNKKIQYCDTYTHLGELKEIDAVSRPSQQFGLANLAVRRMAF